MDGPFGAALLGAATLTTGLMAGLFYAYSMSVMLGLRRTDDRTFVNVMQQINVAILNPWFAVGFVGALLSTAGAALLHLDDDERTTLVWVVLAGVLYVATLVVTFAVNVPLNNRLATAKADGAAEARRLFERRWVRWNIVRTVSSTAAFGCLTIALLVPA